ALLVAVQGCIAQAEAQGRPYPTRPVRIVVGFAPGGGTDIVARLLAQTLSDSLKQPFVVENKAGATGTIGAASGAQSPADGHALLMGHVNSNAIAPALMSRLPYDAIKDFARRPMSGSVPTCSSIRRYRRRLWPSSSNCRSAAITAFPLRPSASAAP